MVRTLLMVGQPWKAKQYLIGNPLVAIQITLYDIRAALYAPLRVLVFESESGRTVVEFDQASTLFGQFGRNEVTAGAVESEGSSITSSQRPQRPKGPASHFNQYLHEHGVGEQHKTRVDSPCVAEEQNCPPVRGTRSQQRN